MNSRDQQNASTIETMGSAFERVNSLFQIDTLASHQYHDTYRRRIPQQPEIRLVLAILEDAINCYKDNFFAVHRKRIQLFKDAHEWFYSDDASWIFSFESICSLLGLEPDYFRQGLKAWSKRETAGRKDKIRGGRMHDDQMVA